MPSKIRIFLIFFVLIGGFIFALHVFGTEGNFTLDIRSPQKATVSDSANKQPLILPPEANLTNVIAKSVAKDLFLQNPQGPLPDSKGRYDAKVNPADAGQHLIDAMQKIQDNNIATIAGSDIIEISDIELHITADTSKDAEKKYLADAGNILHSQLADVQKETILQFFYTAYQNKNMSSVDDLISRHDLAIQELKNVEAPRSWLSEHKELISLLIESKLLLTSWRLYDQDPARGLIAVQEFNTFLSKSADFQKHILTRVQNENLL